MRADVCSRERVNGVDLASGCWCVAIALCKDGTKIIRDE